MKGRPSVNKRLREMARKERQAEKHLRRDERRANRNASPEDAPAPADAVEGGDVALEGAPAAPEPPPGT